MLPPCPDTIAAIATVSHEDQPTVSPRKLRNLSYGGRRGYGHLYDNVRFSLEVAVPAPTLAGQHLTFPVSDLPAGISWYERATAAHRRRRPVRISG